MLVGDFESTLGIKDYWANSQERDTDMLYAQIYTGFFVFFCFMLFVAIILSIKTSPGEIPTEREWDLPDDISELMNIE